MVPRLNFTDLAFQVFRSTTVNVLCSRVTPQIKVGRDVEVHCVGCQLHVLVVSSVLFIEHAYLHGYFCPNDYRIALY